MSSINLSTSIFNKIKSGGFYLVTVIAITAMLSACKKDNSNNIALDERIDLAVAKPETSSMAFEGGLVTGTARIYLTNGKYQLALEDLKSTSGPDLWVYLSKEQQPVNFVSLGTLRSLKGNQLYNIPSDVNPKDYTYAVIYCVSYKHLYGWAKLNFMP